MCATFNFGQGSVTSYETELLDCFESMTVLGTFKQWNCVYGAFSRLLWLNIHWWVKCSKSNVISEYQLIFKTAPIFNPISSCSVLKLGKSSIGVVQPDMLGDLPLILGIWWFFEYLRLSWLSSLELQKTPAAKKSNRSKGNPRSKETQTSKWKPNIMYIVIPKTPKKEPGWMKAAVTSDELSTEIPSELEQSNS